MDGPSILEFTLKKVPDAINKYLKNNFISIDDFDYVIFHQANRFILEKLYKKIGILDKGLIEHELDWVFVGKSATLPIPNPAEVASYRYISLTDLDKEIIEHPNNYTEWLKICIKELNQHIKDSNYFEKKL